MKHNTKKIKKSSDQCSLCSAKFEIMLDNSKLNEERREKISQHILEYCPICSRVDEK